MCIMLRQYIRIPVMREIPPDTVDMIGTVLRVIVLNQKRRPFDRIVVRLATFAHILAQAKVSSSRPARLIRAQACALTCIRRSLGCSGEQRPTRWPRCSPDSAA